MNAATLVLVPICAAALIFAALCIARLAKAWKMSPDMERVIDEDRAQIALEDEKARLFLTLKDLDGEFAAGKLSAADHAALRARFEAEALRVMDDLERHGAS
ncbi:MAG: hypothetical protein U1F43_35365 [Myxococcota bacterium]